MTAFILGATGFVGREVVRQLCVRGEKVIAHVRPDSSSLASWQASFGELGATVDTTAWDVAALAETMTRLAPDQIYILIGTTKHKAKSEHLDGNIYEKVDLGLTRIAVDAAKTSITASSRTPRLVYLSGIGASSSARGAYMKARGQAEEVVRGSGLPWVIARPAIITGERDDSRLGERSAAIIGDGLLAVARVFGGKALRDRYSSTTSDILAAALIRIAEGPDVNRAFDGAELR